MSKVIDTNHRMTHRCGLTRLSSKALLTHTVHGFCTALVPDTRATAAAAGGTLAWGQGGFGPAERGEW